jgi:hypothetical protein
LRGTAGLSIKEREDVMLDVLERQQKLTTNQWKIISAAILGVMLDFFDYGLIASALAFIVGQWKLTYGQSAMILLAAGIGAVPGALVWGWLLIASADARSSSARRSISPSSPGSWR